MYPYDCCISIMVIHCVLTSAFMHRFHIVLSQRISCRHISNFWIKDCNNHNVMHDACQDIHNNRRYLILELSRKLSLTKSKFNQLQFSVTKSQTRLPSAYVFIEP